MDPGTGRWYGGTRCDATVTSPYDISGDGRYIVGGAYWAPLFTNAGGPGFGLCGDFRAFRYDSVTGEFARLESLSNSRTTCAYRSSNDGSVITGYDLGDVSDGAGGFFEARRMCVWTDGVQSILDNISASSAIFAVNSTGTTIAGGVSPRFSQVTFGSNGIKLVRWVRSGNTWTPQSLGRPVDRDQGLAIDILVKVYPSAISADGNTIIGTAVYNQEGPNGSYRPFIWRPSINNGVPIDLQDYLAQIAPGSPINLDGFIAQYAKGISDDGNAMLMDFYDGRNTCTNGGASHSTWTTGVLYLNGTGVACNAPLIAKGPVDWAVNEPYYTLGVALNVAASGTWPLSYQWQREDPANPGTWIDLSDDCSNYPLGDGTYSGFSPTFNYEGTKTLQLRIGMDDIGVCDRAGRYRVVVSNSCGSVASDPAMVVVNPLTLRTQPTDVTICGLEPATAELEYNVFGDTPNYQWQIESAPDVWEDLTFGTFNLSCGGQLIVVDPYAAAMDMTVLACPGGSQFRLRCQLASGCRSATSNAITVTAYEEGNCGGNTCPSCAADYDDNGGIDGADLAAFFGDYEAGETCADVDQNGGIDGADLATFFSVYEAGGC